MACSPSSHHDFQPTLRAESRYSSPSPIVSSTLFHSFPPLTHLVLAILGHFTLPRVPTVFPSSCCLPSAKLRPSMHRLKPAWVCTTPLPLSPPRGHTSHGLSVLQAGASLGAFFAHSSLLPHPEPPSGSFPNLMSVSLPTFHLWVTCPGSAPLTRACRAMVLPFLLL